jgi:hypothetical protein
MFDDLNQSYLTQVYNVIVQSDSSYLCDHFGILHVFSDSKQISYEFF